MIDMVSWIGVGIIAFFALVGFGGVVATSVLTLARSVGARRSEQHAQLEPAVPAR